MKSMTLIELIFVVLILSILSGLAAPTYIRIVSRARESEGWTFLAAIRTSELRYYNENEEIFTIVPAELDLDSTTTPLFTYQITGGGTAFTAYACPQVGVCRGCRVLCVDEDGNQNQGAACVGNPC